MDGKIDPKAPNFKVGDIVKVITRDPQEHKAHPSTFEGIVIALRGEDVNKTFTVRKVSYDKVAVERIFPINSPYIQNVTVVKSTPVRRAKLYYIRNRKNS